MLYTYSMENRVKKVRDILEAEKLDALFISSPYNIRYVTGFDGFGTHEREGFALLTKANLYICADPRLSEGARKNSKGTTIIEFGAEKRLLPQLQEILHEEKIQTIGFEENLTVSELKRFRRLKNVKFKETQEIIEYVRQVKDVKELTYLQHACTLTDATFSFILKNIRTGMTEKDAAWEMEKYIRESGGELAFPTIVAFGKNSVVPHHKTGKTKLEPNSIVLLDFGANVEGYSADMTRTVFMGRAPTEFKKMYETVRVGQEKAFSPQKVTCSGIDHIARDYIKKQGYPSVPHSVGHGVGLEVHELPHITPGYNQEILTNTPFTIEPGIYINGIGGVRIEDTVWWSGKKIISLTHSPKNLIELP